MNTFLQFNSIFISILIEAIPFILVGVLLAGLIQMFVTDEMLKRIIPQNRYLAILFALTIGLFFPACECGIIPVVRRLLQKGVPLHVAIPFMLTAPMINPIVLFSTYVAFGGRWEMVVYRGGLGAVVAFLIGVILSFQYKDTQLIQEKAPHHHHGTKHKWLAMLQHAIDEFFSVGKYLIFGAAIAAAMQTYLQTAFLLQLGQNKATASLVMMALSFVMSLCSEADAFIASSFSSTFHTSAIVAFLVIGPMVDIKNVLMMSVTFKRGFVIRLVAYIVILIWLGSLLLPTSLY